MNIFSAIKQVPKRSTAIIAMIAAAVIVPTTLLAWGPDRETYTIESPADHITFNSITNNPNIGDERNFVGIRETGTTNKWSDDITVEAGKQYTVRMYVHNNAAANLNLVAENVTAMFNLPTTTGTSIRVDGYLSSTNATPTEVYDSATFTSSNNFNLAYVSGSLKYENNSFGATGTALPESIFTSAGAKLGYSALDGKIPGCFQYAGYVTFTVKPQFAGTPNFTISKQVRKTGTTNWEETSSVNPGDSVDFFITYKNTGSTSQKDVIISDVLPKGLTYTAGTTYVVNSTNPNGIKVSDNITKDGINIGNYAANAVAYIKYSATVSSNSDLTDCGLNTLVNTVKATTENGIKEDTATVKVNKTCETTTPELPHTGIGETVASVLGLGTLITSIVYYIASRRALLSR